MPYRKYKKHKSPSPTEVTEIKRLMKSSFRFDRNLHIANLIVTMRQSGVLPIDGPIRLLTALAETEGRPHDISSLAVSLALPRTTVFRHLETMKNRGVIDLRPEGRRTMVYLTDDGWLEFASKWQDIDPVVDAFVMNQAAYMNSDDENEDEEE